MAWLKTLAETYDVCANLAGVDRDGQAILLPISHSTFNAQIEVTVDENGEFEQARKLEKGRDVVTIIPVTEDSAAKTNGIVPHPLCDKLCYIAGDYTQYADEDKEEYFEAYMGQLRDWVESEYTHPMIQAVYNYLKKKTLIRNLVVCKILELDDAGKLTDKFKIQGQGQTEANVRFIVRGDYIPQEVWKNHELYERYNEYYHWKLGERKLCYVSGAIEQYSKKHPAKIRNSGDKAKLISGDDTKGFTYRGRFTSKEQAVSVGYDTSQKAHNALRWLIQKQGYTRDESAIVCWMVNRDLRLPDIGKDSINAYGEIDGFDFDQMDYGTSGLDRQDTGKHFAQQFNSAVNGYAAKIKADDKVAVIALDAATTGRLSVVYYDEMGARQYMDAVLDWQRHCRWRRTIKLEKLEEGRKRITCECTPSPRDMALAAFGVQRSERSEWLEADSKLLRNTVKRLLPCIIRKRGSIPTDLIRAAARRASMPQTMSDFVWYNDVLCVTCAMIRFEYEKEGRIMEHFLEDNLEDRNVLFGRLLAVFDYMEQRAMFEYDENGKVKERRTTNAKRYWNAYSSRPASTCKTIRENLVAYERRLSDYEASKFEKWSEEIMTHLNDKLFTNMALSERYLPGYYQQMEYMKKAFQRAENKGQEEE